MPNRASNSQAASKGVVDHLRHPAILLLILCSLTFLIYCGTLQFEFVWDDQQQIVNNPLIRSFSTVPRAFTSDLWYHTSRGQLYYRPLFLCWSILNYALFGLQPWGWHLGTVLLHILAIPAVYVLSRKLKADHWTAAIAAAIFALHPVHVECVSWISAGSDTMVTVFYVLAFVAFLKSREIPQPHRRTWQLAALLLLAAALFTKEMALTFAMLTAIYAFLFPEASARSFARRAWDAVYGCIPYILLTGSYLVLRTLVLHQVAGSFDPGHGFVDMLLTLPSVLFHYLRLSLLPVGLAGLYQIKYVDSVAGVFPPLISLAIFAGLIWIWLGRTGDRTLKFAATWSVVTLIPVLCLPAFSSADLLVSDRYLYLPSVGFAVLAAKAIRSAPGLRSLSSTAIQAGAVAVLSAIFVVGCIFQQVYWANDLFVFSRAHNLCPQNNFATLNLAYAVGKQGAYDREVRLLRELLDKNPTYGRAYYQLTDAYAALGQKDLARQALQKALTVDPIFVNSTTGMANLAGLYTRLEDYDQAREVCSQVLGREPDLYAALYNCGNVQFLTGNDSEAEKLLSRAVQVGPDLADPNYFLGRTLLRMRRQAEAEKYLTIAAKIQPQGYEYHYWLGQALEMRGAVAEAREQYLQTLKWNPNSEEAKQRLAALERPISLSPVSHP